MQLASSRRKLRAVQVVSGRMFGGGQRVAADLKRGLAESGRAHAEIWLLGVCPEMDGLGDLIIKYDGRYNRLATVFGCARSLRARIRERAPDVIHSHGWDANLIAWLATTGTAVRHVVHLHVLADWLDYKGIRHRARRQLTRWMLSSAAMRMAVSGAVAARWTEALGLSDPVEVVVNGVDTGRYAPAPWARTKRGERPLVLGVASRLVQGKGLEIALDALKLILDRGCAVELHVAGDGPLRTMLSSRAVGLDVASHIRWLGLVRDMPAFYRNVDLYVQASQSEGMPLGLLEAMACGCPAVATDVGGTSEVLRDGVDGYLVEPGSAHALAAAIIEAISDVETLATMARAARSRITDAFDLNQTYDSIAGHYHQICTGGRFVRGNSGSL